jgi:CelD/BcsL family acetyltransferase involved in cellulose biosynthesis
VHRPEIKIINDYQEFRSLKDEWNRLLKSNFSRGVWLRHEWYDCWWRAFGEGAQLFVVVMYESGRLSAVFPLMIVSMRIKGTHQRVMRFIENGISPRSNFIFPGISVEKLKVVWDEILRHSSQWDLAILANFEKDNPGYECWRRYLKEHKVNHVEVPERISPYISLADGWDAVRNSFGRNLRRNINRARARLEKEGMFELVEHVFSGDVLDSLRRCYDISKVSWKGQQDADMGGSERRMVFYDFLTDEAINNGWINIWLLRFGDKYIAFEYALEWNGYVLPIAADYDLGFKQYSPGVVLRSLVLEQLIKREMMTYDFAGMAYDYKLYWTKRLRLHSQFWVFHDGLKSRMLFLMKAKLLPAIARLKSRPQGINQADAHGDDSQFASF